MTEQQTIFQQNPGQLTPYRIISKGAKLEVPVAYTGVYFLCVGIGLLLNQFLTAVSSIYIITFGTAFTFLGVLLSSISLYAKNSWYYKRCVDIDDDGLELKRATEEKPVTIPWTRIDRIDIEHCCVQEVTPYCPEILHHQIIIEHDDGNESFTTEEFSADNCDITLSPNQLYMKILAFHQQYR